MHRPANAEIETGDWRPLNLGLPPFGLPAPVRLIDEGNRGDQSDKRLGVWRLADIAVAPGQTPA